MQTCLIAWLMTANVIFWHVCFLIGLPSVLILLSMGDPMLRVLITGSDSGHSDLGQSDHE